MNYVYGCTKDKSHPRKEVQHAMKENPVILCDKCGAKMARVPQPFRIGFNAGDILIDWLDNNAGISRATKGDRSQFFSPDLVKRPGKPIPGRDFYNRREVPRWQKKQ